MIRMIEAAFGALMRFDDSVDRECGAVSKERIPALIINFGEPRPEMFGLPGQLGLPTLMTGLDCFGPGRVAKTRKGSRETVTRRNLQAGVAAVAVEQAQGHCMQHSQVGDLVILRDRVTHGQGPVRGKFCLQALGNGHTVILTLGWE